MYQDQTSSRKHRFVSYDLEQLPRWILENTLLHILRCSNKVTVQKNGKVNPCPTPPPPLQQLLLFFSLGGYQNPFLFTSPTIIVNFYIVNVRISVYGSYNFPSVRPSKQLSQVMPVQGASQIFATTAECVVPSAYNVVERSSQGTVKLCQATYFYCSPTLSQTCERALKEMHSQIAFPETDV